MNVAIFGGGIAGLTTAIGLGRYGHHSSIYERIWLSHEAGMGFIMLRDAAECLEEFGVQLKGMPLNCYRCRDARGTILNEQIMPEGAIGIRRRELISALIDALPVIGFIVVDCALDS